MSFERHGPMGASLHAEGCSPCASCLWQASMSEHAAACRLKYRTLFKAPPAAVIDGFRSQLLSCLDVQPCPSQVGSQRSAAEPGSVGLVHCGAQADMHAWPAGWHACHVCAAWG